MAETSDIIKHVVDENPLEVKKAVADLMIDKVRDVIAGKRAEVAQNFFGATQGPEDAESDDEAHDDLPDDMGDDDDDDDFGIDDDDDDSDDDGIDDDDADDNTSSGEAEDGQAT